MVPHLRGFAANLEQSERHDVKELAQMLTQFEGKVCFVYRHNEIKLHGIRYSGAKKEIVVLLKDAKN